MKKLIKVFLVLILVAVASFGIYAYKLHSLANEGNNLFEQRCLQVNPHLIAYKNSFLTMADMINNPENYEAGSGSEVFQNYIAEMDNYLEAEDNWLDKQSAYINRWDFQLFEPWYIKQAADYQIQMYEGYRDDAKYMMEVYNAGGATDELWDKQGEARDRRDKYSQLYYEFGNEATEIFDLRKFLAIVPAPEGCTEENMTIPNTSGAINWDGSEESTPAPVISDPDLVS